MNTESKLNIDRSEQEKFDAIASGWWDPDGPFRPLHDLNPARPKFVADRAELDGARAIDVGCGGGILAESLADEGAKVTGIDVAPRVLATARLHLHESGHDVEYREVTVEAMAEEAAGSFDVLTCMEMLEHVPDPASVIGATARLLKPGGQAFYSTLNRTPMAFALGIVGAEHVLRLLPRGTHRWREFRRPVEVETLLRARGLEVRQRTGVALNPLRRHFSLVDSMRVNYMLLARRPAEP